MAMIHPCTGRVGDSSPRAVGRLAELADKTSIHCSPAHSTFRRPALRTDLFSAGLENTREESRLVNGNTACKCVCQVVSGGDGAA
eukprot:CAMPEP_0197907348 /NCGR_PEP_ID=MMETSP1439-20131203/64675_1 /TAXON_ID=66791 /ORGANISM="Gonyaulax spinifera, Strain CCMP409" /LENGTH=84 /DNA_ID=CAMNT_0043528773 /DNA_START=62 /DNA_END=313 /DNA_ORIENTATION=+